MVEVLQPTAESRRDRPRQKLVGIVGEVGGRVNELVLEHSNAIREHGQSSRRVSYIAA